MVSIQIIKILRKEEKQMKKLLSLVLIGALALSLTACGNSSSKDNSSSKETTTTKKEEKQLIGLVHMMLLLLPLVNIHGYLIMTMKKLKMHY